MALPSDRKENGPSGNSPTIYSRTEKRRRLQDQSVKVERYAAAALSFLEEHRDDKKPSSVVVGEQTE